MLALQSYDAHAVRAAVGALIIVGCRTRKGRKRLDDAIALLQSQSIAANVTPIDRRAPRPDRMAIDEAGMYLETIRTMLDEGRV